MALFDIVQKQAPLQVWFLQWSEGKIQCILSVKSGKAFNKILLISLFVKTLP
jgi:hypothetical protein